MYDLIYTAAYAIAENMNPYWLVITAYVIHRHSLNRSTNHPHLSFLPTKYIPATPIMASIHDHHILYPYR